MTGPVAWREDDEIAGRFSQRCSVFRVIARRAHSGVAGLHGLPPEVAERSLRRNEANRSVSVPVARRLGDTRSRQGRAVAIQRSTRAPFACVGEAGGARRAVGFTTVGPSGGRRRRAVQALSPSNRAKRSGRTFTCGDASCVQPAGA